MSSKAQARKDFAPAAGERGEIVPFPKPAKPERLTGEALRLDQFRRQSEELAKITDAKPAYAAVKEPPSKEVQDDRYTPTAEKNVAGQAEIQENDGNIFSRGYDRFFGIV